MQSGYSQTNADTIADGVSDVEGVRVWKHAPLAPFTSIGVGGKADLLLTVAGTGSTLRVLSLLVEQEIPWTVLGAGSNLLVGDRGFSGVVLKLDEDFHFVEGPDARGNLTAGGGLSLPRLTAFAAEMGLGGLEFSCGIPGSIGGAVAMNAGTHAGDMAGVTSHLELVTADGVLWAGAEDLEWEYRGCRLPPASVVTGVKLSLRNEKPPEVAARHRSLLRKRRQVQPRGVRTFGSAFRNPSGDAAGRLLDGAGMKGIRYGDAQVSVVHANFITNLGGARTSDVLGLMAMMRDAVWDRYGISLEPEVHLLGEIFPWESE